MISSSPRSTVAILSIAILALATPLLAQSMTDAEKLAYYAANPDSPGMGRATGGPDAFGYTFTDSAEPDGPTFSWIDITGTGTAAALADDDEVAVPMGFNFDFYGTTYTDAYASSNGYVSFIAGLGGDFTNDCPFLAGTSPDEIVAPYWDDLDPGDDGASLYFETLPVCPIGAGGMCTVVSWVDFDFFPGDGTPGGTAGSFQTIFFDNGQILHQYADGFLGDGASSTVGISSDHVDMGNSLQYQCDSAGTITPGLAIEFSPIAAPGTLEVPTLSTFAKGTMFALLAGLAIVVMRRTQA